MHRLKTLSSRRVPLFFIAVLLVPVVFSADLEKSLSVVSATNISAVASQKKIDSLASETQGLLEEYRKLSDGAQYQDAYAEELKSLEFSQEQKIADLQRQIAQAKITQQRIVPLMRSMVEALEKFVILDLPFHQEERLASVLLLKKRLQQPNLSVSSRFSLLLEAYQLEQEYGDTVEAWRGPLEIEGQQLSVQFLRVGRVALYFQTLDGENGGYWNKRERSWIKLKPDYKRELAQALAVANKRVAPQLLTLPMIVFGDGL